LFEQRVLEVVATHTDPDRPLFLFWAPHIAHAPLQAPQPYIDYFNFIAQTDKAEHERQHYHAMVKFADDAIGNVTMALKQKELWDDLIMVFFADNGGWVSANGTRPTYVYQLWLDFRASWLAPICSHQFARANFLAGRGALVNSRDQPLWGVWCEHASPPRRLEVERVSEN
jgi:hypothetical protein